MAMRYINLLFTYFTLLTYREIARVHVSVPAVLNEAVPAAMRDVESELQQVLVDVSRYTCMHTVRISSCLSA